MSITKPNVPQISMRTLTAYKTDKELIDNVPIHCQCDTIKTFDELKIRYKRAGLKYLEFPNTYEIKS